MGVSLIPTWFADATTSFYGTSSDEQQQIKIQTDVWKAFLRSEDAEPFVIIDPTTQQKVLRSGYEDSAIVQARYLSFLQSQLSRIYQAETVTALSPEEIHRRKAVFTIFDILLTLINSAMKTQVLTGEAFNFLARKEAAYADLMARVFFYIGRGTIYPELVESISELGYNPTFLDTSVERISHSGEELPSSLDWYLTKPTYPSLAALEQGIAKAEDFTFGYGNISLPEIAEYVANVDPETITTAETQRFFLRSSPFQMDYTRTHYETDDDGNVSTVTELMAPCYAYNCVSIKLFKNGQDQLVAKSSYILDMRIPNFDASTYTYAPTVYVASNTDSNLIVQDPTDPASIQEAVEQSFLNLFSIPIVYNTIEISSNPDGFISGAERDQLMSIGEYSPRERFRQFLISERRVTIPWELGSLAGVIIEGSEEQKGRFQSYIQTRAAMNQTLSSFVDNIKAKRDIFRNKRDQAQQIMDASSSARKMSAQVIESCIGQLKNILSSIFR